MNLVKSTVIAALIVIGATLMSPTLVRAQEGEPVVIDEVIAQVNDGIVTLSQLKREMTERVRTMVQAGMPDPQATAWDMCKTPPRPTKEVPQALGAADVQRLRSRSLQGQ